MYPKECTIQVWQNASVLGSFLPREATSCSVGVCIPINQPPVGPTIIP